MPESDRDRLEDLLGPLVIMKIQEIPIEEREGRVLPRECYVTELADEGLPAGAEINVKNVRVHVDRNLPRRLFRDVFDFREPLASSWVLNEATGLAVEVTKRKEHLAKRYCSALIDRRESLGYAYLGLETLAERMKKPHLEEVQQPYPYLRAIIISETAQDVKERVRQLDPWSREHYDLTKELQKARELAHPDEDELKAEEHAAEEADRALRRVPFDEVEGIPSEEPFDQDLAEWIEERIKHPPFTHMDRRTWALWRAVDFHGADIDWRAARVKPSTGRQRLSALKRKLRRVLSEGDESW